IESSIAKVTAQYEKLGTTGHSKLSLIEKDLAELGRLQAAMSNATDSTTLVTSYTKYNNVLSRVRNSLATVSSESKAFVSSLQINTLDNNISSWLQKNSRASKEFGVAIQQLRNRLAQLNNSGKATRSELDAIEQEFREIRVQAQLAGQTGVSFGHQLSGAFKSILRYVSVSTIIYAAANAIRQMYENVVEVNSQMTELKKVTNETDATYDKFLNNANKKAKELGTTVSDLVASAADFARLGYSMSDAEYLAEVANVYAVVGDEIESIDTATKSLISTMVAFKVDANDAMTIVDKFNEVGNKFAISSGGIGDALERSSASLAAANNTLDQSIALITAANTVVQDADIVGTAFKTIAMRIRGAKTELEEAGLETEGMAESTATLRNEILALSGVDIMIDDSTFKSTYDILDELSKKWQDLTDIQQASITELIAGKRQGQVVSAVMNNFDIARKVVTTSEGSEGSATAEHEKWLDSLEAKINQLAASWESLSQAFLEDDFIANLIDGGAALLDVLTQVVDAIGLLGVAIAGVGIYAFIKNFD
ncbi:MAG: phage tail tape measure protein, partial [Agathobacter sp.]